MLHLFSTLQVFGLLLNSYNPIDRKYDVSVVWCFHNVFARVAYFYYIEWWRLNFILS